MKTTSLLALTTLAILSYAAPTSHVSRSLFGDISSTLSNLGHSLQNATLSGVAGAITQSIENPGLTGDRIQVVTSLASSQKAIQNIATQANGQQNTQVMTFAAQAAKGLSDTASAVNRIGQSLITGTTASLDDQKDVAVGIKGALDAVSCMDAGGNANLNDAIQAANAPLNQLKTAGEGVIAAQNHSLADLGLPSDFADEPANCTLSS